MNAAKKKKQNSGPKWMLLWFSALTMALIGAFSGFLVLTAFPGKVFAEEASYREFLEKQSEKHGLPKNTAFLEGSVAQDRGWEKDRERWLNGDSGRVEFTDKELNAWLASVVRRPNASAESEGMEILLIPGVPKLFFDQEDRVHIKMPLKSSAFGMTGKCAIFARGRFAEDGSDTFSLEGLYMNAARVPVPDGLANFAFRRLLEGFNDLEEAAEVKEAFGAVKEVHVTDGRLVLELD